jgi:hypothetical protein
MVIPPFKDPKTRECFGRDGYFVFEGLARNDVPALVAVYQDMLRELPGSDPYFHCPMTGTNYVGNRGLRDRITARVSEIVAPRLAPLVDAHRVLGAGFRVKQTGNESHLPLHQDPSMVDEDRDWSMNFIIPIVDTTVANGALRVVPGSHRVLPKYRSLDLQDRAETLGILDAIAEQVTTLPMHAGDVILYFNSILHGSGPNRTDEHRPVVLGTLISREAPMLLYLISPESPKLLECYEVPDNYFNQMENFHEEFKLRPKVGRRLADVRDTYDLSREQIIGAIRAHDRAQ